MAQEVWKRSRKIPKATHKLMSSLLLTVPPGKWDAIFDVISPAMRRQLRINTPIGKVHKLARILYPIVNVNTIELLLAIDSNQTT